MYFIFIKYVMNNINKIYYKQYKYFIYILENVINYHYC